MPFFAVETPVDEESEVGSSVLPTVEDIFMLCFYYYLCTNSFQLSGIKSVTKYLHQILAINLLDCAGYGYGNVIFVCFRGERNSLNISSFSHYYNQFLIL
jgi:hypothetical protein